MYQHLNCISPNRRQAKNYLEVDQPMGESSSLSALNPELHSSRVSEINLSVSQQPSQTYDRYNGYQKHEDLLSKITDTIRQSEVHNSSVNERLSLQKA